VDIRVAKEVKEEKMCPRFPEAVPLKHPIPVLMNALDKVRSKKKILCKFLDHSDWNIS